jgi:hypothetical protein
MIKKWNIGTIRTRKKHKYTYKDMNSTKIFLFIISSKNIPVEI